MGDMRASVKIEIDYIGIKDKCDMWMNYNPDGECEGVDDRIVEFFRRVHEKAVLKYNRLLDQQFARQHAGEIKEQELKELKRLQVKYAKEADNG